MKNEKHFTRGDGLFENFLAKKRAKLANKLIPDNLRKGRILDVGCGTIPYFLINTKFNEKYGIDKIFNSMKNIIQLDIEKNAKFPFKNDFFDIITMLAVFEHLEPTRLPDIIKEIRRILKPRGRFILTTPCPWTDRVLKVMAKLKLITSKEIEEHKGVYNKSSIANYFSKAGFEKNKMKFGYFEMFLNNWAYVDK